MNLHQFYHNQPAESVGPIIFDNFSTLNPNFSDPQTILAYELNDKPLPIKNGAPLRLRLERQLGYKMVKYVIYLEIVEDFSGIAGEKGSYWEDQGYERYVGI